MCRRSSGATYENAVAHGDGAQLLEQKLTTSLSCWCVVDDDDAVADLVIRVWETCFPDSTPSSPSCMSVCLSCECGGDAVCSTVTDLKIEGEQVRNFLPTFVAPRSHPYGEHDGVASSSVFRVCDGLAFSLTCTTMNQAITDVMSPTHPSVFVAACVVWGCDDEVCRVTHQGGTHTQPAPCRRQARCSWTRICWCLWAR
jgi:hypothetical protein